MIDKDTLEKIQAYAVYIDWQVAFDGKAYGNRHLFRVVTIADFLAKKEGANREICEAGAWLHDVGLIEGNDDNPVAIRQVAEKYLTNLGLDEDRKRQIAECVETHEGVSQAVSLEARVVHDADVLDKMGLLGVIRHTWKIVNLIQIDANASEVCSLVQKHLPERRDKLYTASARKLAEALKAALHQFFADRTRAVESVALIMQDAQRGIISDEIAKQLLLKRDHQTLMHQLFITDEILQWWYEQG